jgi:serine/threonine protein kinase/energy-coupling factor transporter ATP-binding protein EcfA2
MKLCPSCKNGFAATLPACPVCGTSLAGVDEVDEDQLVGMRVADRYELRELLSEGSMGRVYRAVHLALRRSVAVKLLKTSVIPEPEAVSLFEQEAQAVSRLNHPHIVSVIDFGRTPGGQLYLVTEFVGGSTLAELLAQPEPLALARAIDIFHQILAAVEEAHSAQVIHRDLKPENIVVTPLRSGSDFVKVLDFGIAIFRDEAGSTANARRGIDGTPGYIAPETITEGRATEQSDIYALGNVLFEMLTGGAVFHDRSPMALLSMHVTQPAPLLREAAPQRGYSAELEQVVARALAKRETERFASIAEFRSALLYATSLVAPLDLRCNGCVRPRDPATGLCALHGPASTAPVSVPASGRKVDVTSRTLVEAGADHQAALVSRVLHNLVGRQAEAEQAVEFFRSEQRLLEVLGGPGSGKTALLQALEGAAESLGHTVRRMRADASRARRPWYPVRRLVGELIGCGAQPRSAAEVTQSATRFGVLWQHLVGLVLLFGFDSTAAAETGPKRMASIQHAAYWVIATAEDAPAGVCIMADDVLDYDRASQSFLHYLALRIEELRGKLVLSADADFWPVSKLRAVIRPSPLSLHDIRVWLERTANLGPGEVASVAQRIAEASEGNALHAQQAIRGHAEGCRIEQPLRDLLADRLARLSAETLRLLHLICALGSETPRSLLAELAGGVDTLGPLESLTDRGLVLVDQAQNVSPAHASLAQAVLDLAPRDRRRALHAELVAKLEQAGASVFELAHHAHQAELGEQTLQLLRAAGEEACRWADEETAALLHYRRAVHVARWHLLWGEDEEPYLELALALGDALFGSGHRHSAEVVFKEALSGAGRFPSIQQRVRAGLAALS